MKVSIITVAYNSKTTLAGTIESVLNQQYPDIEYILVDGGSNDGTVELIRSYGDRIAKFVSEKDAGIYDAMNKGIKMATGAIVGFINADDLYADKEVIGKVVKVFEQNKIDSCYGDLQYVDREDTSKVIRYWRSQPYEKNALKRGWYPPHPTFFVKREIFEKYGPFNLKFRISADYELTLRFLEKYKISTCYIPEVLVKMRVGGTSNKSIINIIRANLECYRAWQENGLPISFWEILLKPLTKARQYLKMV